MGERERKKKGKSLAGSHRNVSSLSLRRERGWREGGMEACSTLDEDLGAAQSTPKEDKFMC